MKNKTHQVVTRETGRNEHLTFFVSVSVFSSFSVFFLLSSLPPPPPPPPSFNQSHPSHISFLVSFDGRRCKCKHFTCLLTCPLCYSHQKIKTFLFFTNSVRFSKWRLKSKTKVTTFQRFPQKSQQQECCATEHAEKSLTSVDFPRHSAHWQQFAVTVTKTHLLDVFTSFTCVHIYIYTHMLHKCKHTHAEVHIHPC